MRSVPKEIQRRGKQETGWGGLAARCVNEIASSIQVHGTCEVRFFVAKRRNDVGKVNNSILVNNGLIYTIYISNVTREAFDLRLVECWIQGRECPIHHGPHLMTSIK